MTPGAGTRLPFTANVFPLNATIPRCRAPIGSKGKQQFGALSSGERSIKLTTAVKVTALGGGRRSAPYVHRILVAIKPLLTDKDYYAVAHEDNLLDI